MLKYSPLSALICLIIYNCSNAQPAPGWISFFPNSIGFYDLFACDNGDVVACGMGGGWEIVRVDAEGGEVWYKRIVNNGRANSVIEADNGDLVFGGNLSGQFSAVRLSEGGDEVWHREYGPGVCTAVVELKDGTLAFAGYTSGNPILGKLVITTDNGEPVVNRTYDHRPPTRFWSIREVEDGVVLLGSYGNLVWLTKIDFDGDPIWEQDYGDNARTFLSYNALVTTDDGGFAFLVSPSGGGQLHPGLTKSDARGNVEWSNSFDNMEISSVPGLVKLPNFGFVIVGSIPNANGNPFALFLDNNGEEIALEYYHSNEGEEFDLAGLRSVVVSQNLDVYAAGAGFSRRQQGVLTGAVMRLGRFPSEPILRWSPVDTLQTVLLGDTIRFTAFASDIFNREFSYEWLVNDTAVNDNDTAHTIIFDEAGDIVVECRVTLEPASVAIRWHVTVTDLYISEFSPDTLNLTLRRGASVDFSLDIVRYVGEQEPEYLWTKANLSNGEQEDSGTEAGATIDFPWSGDYTVEGKAYRGESSDQVTWNVAVRGAIWAYVPEALAFDVEPESVVHFEVVPSEPENESLSIQWLIDGELAAEDTVALEWAFGIAGGEADSCPPYQVQCVVADSVEADTVTWDVTVRDLAVPHDGSTADPPRSAGILSVSPNPFNSMLTIMFSLTPGFGEAGLRIYDLSGRLVVDLTTGRNAYPPGEHKVVWDAGDQPAGVYLVRLENGAEISTHKVVLIR